MTNKEKYTRIVEILSECKTKEEKINIIEAYSFPMEQELEELREMKRIVFELIEGDQDES